MGSILSRPQRVKAGYLLRVAPECATEWQDYRVGDPVPLQAVRVSSWKDGTPLYSVCARLGDGWFLGYYLPVVQRPFIMNKKTENPTFVRMLVFV